MMRVFRARLRRFRAKVLDKLDRMEQEALETYNTSRGRPVNVETPAGHRRLGE